MPINAIVIFCPDLSSYPKQPIDMSNCHLVDCPNCNKKMWMSEKKEKIIKASEGKEMKVILACYPCTADMVIKNPEIMKDHVRVNI